MTPRRQIAELALTSIAAAGAVLSASELISPRERLAVGVVTAMCVAIKGLLTQWDKASKDQQP